MMDRWSCLAATMLAATLVLAPAATAFAHEEDEEGEKVETPHEHAEPEAPEEEADGPNQGRVSLLIQNDFTNAYIFRGIMNEKKGFIWQPWAELWFSLYESDEGPFRSLSFGTGIWNSVQSEKTLAQHDPKVVYETDVYPMFNIDFPWGLSLLTTYYFYTSPNGGFDTVQELNFKGSWDDSEYLERFALGPWINFAMETDRTSFGDKEGSGIQMGVGPTLYEVPNETYPLAFTVPVELGISIDDYYEEPGRSNDVFGYLSWGLTATLPITAIPDDYGAWSVSVGGKGYYFSNALARVNTGKHLYPTVTGSLTIEY